MKWLSSCSDHSSVTVSKSYVFVFPMTDMGLNRSMLSSNISLFAVGYWTLYILACGFSFPYTINLSSSNTNNR